MNVQAAIFYWNDCDGRGCNDCQYADEFGPEIGKEIPNCFTNADSFRGDCHDCESNAARVGLALAKFKEDYDQAVSDALRVVTPEVPHA